MASRMASTPNAENSEAKNRLLVTDGDVATRGSHDVMPVWSRLASSLRAPLRVAQRHVRIHA
jgi:hypothetical protein